MKILMTTVIDVDEAKEGFMEHYEKTCLGHLPPGHVEEFRAGKQIGFYVKDPSWNVTSTTTLRLFNEAAAVETPGGT